MRHRLELSNKDSYRSILTVVLCVAAPVASDYRLEMDFMPPLLEALESINDPTLFGDERGYQGEVKSQLDRVLALKIHERDFATPQVREEYQKRAFIHGIKLRPDIIIHIPYDRGVSPSRRHDNYMVILLKRAARRAKAMKNFQSLETICSVLNYPVGVSINISSSKLWLSELKPEIPSSFTLHEIAVTLAEGKVDIQIATRKPVNAT